MKIINAEGGVLGRIAGYAAKQALLGEKIVIVNCNKIIITGNKKFIRENFEEKRRRVGSGQHGPRYPRESYRIVKRTIRGMLPSHIKGRGRQIYKDIRCYNEVPEEFKDSKMISMAEKKIKSHELKEFAK